MDLVSEIPSEILDDLCSRFIINVPEKERCDLIRICFQIESAHWYYIDFYSNYFPNRKLLGMREFTYQIFCHIPFLVPFKNYVDEVLQDWKDYKYSVPTFGAILLDEDLTHVLLVQNYKSSWGFPKGKVNKNEPPYQCAIREVYEETGFDISHLIDPNDYLEATVKKQVRRLYIIPGVRKCEKFVPQTRNEIKAVKWFPICDLPLNKKQALLKQTSFSMVAPFLSHIRHWIFEYRLQPRRKHLKSLRQRNRSCSDMDSVLYKGENLNFQESVEMLQSYKDSGGRISNKSNSGEIGDASEPESSGMHKVRMLINQVVSQGTSFDPQAIKSFKSGSAKHLYKNIRWCGSIEKLDEIDYESLYTSEHYPVPESTFLTDTGIQQTRAKKNKRRQGKKNNKANKAEQSYVIEDNQISTQEQEDCLRNGFSGLNYKVEQSPVIEDNQILTQEQQDCPGDNFSVLINKLNTVEQNPVIDDNQISIQVHQDYPENIFSGAINKVEQSKVVGDNQISTLGQQDCSETRIPLLEFRPITEIKAWTNFKFDIDAIIKAMTDAVIRD